MVRIFKNFMSDEKMLSYAVKACETIFEVNAAVCFGMINVFAVSIL